MNKDLNVIGFENENMRDFAEVLYSELPEYWHHVPASSTGKYHPTYALGDGGLKRHTFALIKILNYILGLEYFKNMYTSEQRDAFRIAGLVHDGWKSGTQLEYENNKYTRIEHPLIASEQIWKHANDGNCDPKIVAAICNMIESHMGQWNTDKNGDEILPKPATKEQILLHICDYLASRKDIIILFGDEEKKEDHSKEELVDHLLKTYVMPFGKHKGTLLKDVPDDYIRWLSEQELREPLKSCVEELRKNG